VESSFERGNEPSDPLDLVTPSMIMWVQMLELSRLGWLIGFVKHATWAQFSVTSFGVTLLPGNYVAFVM
jgi:hypothetical protein